jgi:hypothetical protein
MPLLWAGILHRPTPAGMPFELKKPHKERLNRATHCAGHLLGRLKARPWCLTPTTLHNQF